MQPRPRGRPRKQGPKRPIGRPRCAPRDAAKAAGAKVYEWTPCPTCGCTVRWVRTYNCVVCRRRKQREADARERARLAAWSAKVGAEGVLEAVQAAISEGALPPQRARRSRARGPYRKPVPKPQEPQP